MNYKTIEPEDNYSFYFTWAWEEDVPFENIPAASYRVGTMSKVPLNESELAKFLEDAGAQLNIVRIRNAAKDSSTEDR